MTPYFGLGLVQVTLPERDYSFLALHGIIGMDYVIAKHLAFYMEFGWDLGEALIADEDEEGNAVLPGEDNQIDINMAAGITININESFYLKTYIRYHEFDGADLLQTTVTFVGVRVGIGF